MNNTLVTIANDKAELIYKKLIQAQNLVALLSDATEERDGMIEKNVVSNAMWLLDDLLQDATIELETRKYLKEGKL